MSELMDKLMHLPRDRMMPETLLKHAFTFKLKEKDINDLRAAKAIELRIT